MITLLWALIPPFQLTAIARSVIDLSVVKDRSTSTAQLLTDAGLARIEATHPLVRAMEVELSQVREKILKSLQGVGTDRYKMNLRGSAIEHVTSLGIF